MALNLFTKKAGPPPGVTATECQSRDQAWNDFQPAEPQQLETDPLSRLYQQHRYAVILAQCDHWKSHAQGLPVCTAAAQRLEEELAVVPDGYASLTTTLDDSPGSAEIEIEVPAFQLAIYPVTNQRFQQFVDDGGYDDLTLWPQSIWPHLIELHDQTDKPGPRFWVDGRHDRRWSNLPVVGISWYEAVAYARWVGLRLPIETEWQMAASWRIKSEADVFRRFPWGDAMDYQRCNVWGAGLGRIAPVHAFEMGAAPNGVQQLIGNVWEWTASDFEITDPSGRIVVGEMPFRSIRGGAFDTYFDSQATAAFRTGQILLARSHNVGVRLATNV